MTGVPWAELSFGVAALVVVGSVVLGAYKIITNSNKYVARLIGNHMNHLTAVVEHGMHRLADSNDRLREHCAEVWVKRTD